MDSRDSIAAAGVGSREASLSMDEDAATMSLTRGLAKEAVLLFQSQKYSECVDVLLQILQKIPDDPKVLHNIAIAEYFRDGCSDPIKLLDVLSNVKIQCEELARASVEQAEAGGNKNVSGSKVSGNMPNQLAAASSGTVIYANEFDTSVVSLNIGIVWFHLHEYKKSLSVVEPLYQNIGPIDETIALKICILLLDVALASHEISKSADLISYLDKAFNVGFTVSHGDNGSIGKQQSSNLITKSSSVQASIDTPTSDSTGSANALENSLSRTLLEDTIDYENLFSTLNIGGNYSSTSNLLTTLADRTMPTLDLKLKLQLYKVQFLLITRNLKAVKREVKEAMNMVRGRDSSMALLLKSQLEYARGNHRKAIKLLMASSNGPETGTPSIFNNNFGCIYYHLGKQHTSSLFFSKALNSSYSLMKEKPRNLLTFSQDKSLLIIYNCGLQYLACGKPVLAASCFQKASLIFYKQPLLWFRIAECCIMALDKGILRTDGTQNGSEIRLTVIGKGKWRQLGINDSGSKIVHTKSIERRGDLFSDDKQPKLTLTLARHCLVNALHLLNSSESKYEESSSPSNKKRTAGPDQGNSNGEAKEQKGGTSLHDLLTNSISDFKEICEKEKRVIKQAALANLAYVEFELKNPIKAFSSAMSLLNVLECSRTYLFFGHVYAAEALLLLNKPKEAADHLLIYLTGENNIELPHGAEDSDQWRVEKVVDSDGNSNVMAEDYRDRKFFSPEDSRGILFVNLATMYAIQGDLEQAHQFAKEGISALPNNSQAILAEVFVEMKMGKTEEALAKLKRCSHVRFVNGKNSR